MKYNTVLVHGRLIKRYKRFLADIELDNGEIITAHCTNSGSMKSCIEEGAEVYLSETDNPKRKTCFTWEMIRINNSWVGINTLIPNKLSVKAIQNNEIEKLKGYAIVKPEVKFLDSRFDIYIENEVEKGFVEVKNVSLKDGEYARFPDSVSARGKKHLETLIKVKENGYRAVMLYIIQRTDVSIFAPADDIDPEYGKALRKAYKAGVEIISYQVKVNPERVELLKEIPFKL